MKKILSALVLGLMSATAAQAADVRFMYSTVDNKNSTYSDRFAIKAEESLPDNYGVDARASVSHNRSTEAITAAYEIGASKKFPLDKKTSVYLRPELGTSVPSGTSGNHYVGFEVGVISRPFSDERYKLKADHAWIEGLNNDRTDGTLTRVQATYDVTSTLSVGPRVEFRRGNTESDAITLILTQKF